MTTTVVKDLARKWFLKGDNRICFTDNSGEAHYGMYLFANWIWWKHGKVLEKNLRRWGQSKKNKRAYVSFVNISHFNEKLHRCDCLEMNELQSKCQ